MELLVTAAITGVVSVVMLQTLNKINLDNKRLTEQILATSEIEALGDVLQISLGRSLDSRVSGSGACLHLLREDLDGSQRTLHVRAVDAADVSNTALGFQTANIYMRSSASSNFGNTGCYDTQVTDPAWSLITGGGIVRLSGENDSLSFDLASVNAQIDAGWDSDLLPGTQYRTVEFWLDIGNLASGQHDLFRMGHQTDRNQAMRAYLDDGRVTVGIANHWLRTRDDFRGVGWTHFAISFNPNNPTDTDDGSVFDIYVNGQKLTLADNDVQNSAAAYTSQAVQAGQPFYFGWKSEPNGSGSYINFIGRMDELRLWRETGTETEVADRIARFYLTQVIDSEFLMNLIATYGFDVQSRQSDGYLPEIALNPITDMTFELSAGTSVVSGSPASPAIPSYFETQYTALNRVVRTNFSFESSSAGGSVGYATRQNRSYTSASQVPVVTLKPAGIIPIPEGGSGTVGLTVEGGRTDFDLDDIRFQVVFTPNLQSQANACDDFYRTPGACQFSEANPVVEILKPVVETAAKCTRDSPGGADITCRIYSTGDTTMTDGIRYAWVRVADGLSYNTIPGEQFQVQLYEPCTAPSSDAHTSLLADVGTIVDGSFINNGSYLTYSWEAIGNETMQEIFAGAGGVGDSPDWQFWVRRNAISPVLFHQTGCASPKNCDRTPDGWWFAVGFDRSGRPNIEDWNSYYRDLFDLDPSDPDPIETIDAPTYTTPSPPIEPSIEDMQDVYYISTVNSDAGPGVNSLEQVVLANTRTRRVETIPRSAVKTGPNLIHVSGADVRINVVADYYSNLSSNRLSYQTNGGSAIGNLADNTDYFPVFPRYPVSSANVQTSGSDRNWVRINSHGFDDNDQVIYFSNGGNAIGGLVDRTRYFVKVRNGNSIRFASTSGGTTISLTSGGNDNQFFISRNKIRLASNEDDATASPPVTINLTTQGSNGQSLTWIANQEPMACERGTDINPQTTVTGGVGELSNTCPDIEDPGRCRENSLGVWEPRTGNLLRPFNHWCIAAWQMSNMPVSTPGTLSNTNQWPIWYDENNEFTIPAGTGNPPYGVISAINGWRNGNVDGYVALMTTDNVLRNYRFGADERLRNPTFRVSAQRGQESWFLQTAPYNVPVTWEGFSYQSEQIDIEPGQSDAIRFRVSTAIACPYDTSSYTIYTQD